jgi:hypothetical protein
MKMSKNEFELRSIEDIDLLDLRMSSKMWGKQGLVPMGKFIEHTSIYGTGFSMKKQNP